jgi:hypothetical protein
MDQRHIIAQYKNMFDIADIYRYRRGGVRTLWTPDIETNEKWEICWAAFKKKQNYENGSFELHPILQE